MNNYYVTNVFLLDFYKVISDNQVIITSNKTNEEIESLRTFFRRVITNYNFSESVVDDFNIQSNVYLLDNNDLVEYLVKSVVIIKFKEFNDYDKDLISVSEDKGTHIFKIANFFSKYTSRHFSFSIIKTVRGDFSMSYPGDYIILEDRIINSNRCISYSEIERNLNELIYNLEPYAYFYNDDKYDLFFEIFGLYINQSSYKLKIMLICILIEWMVCFYDNTCEDNISKQFRSGAYFILKKSKHIYTRNLVNDYFYNLYDIRSKLAHGSSSKISINSSLKSKMVKNKYLGKMVGSSDLLTVYETANLFLREMIPIFFEMIELMDYHKLNKIKYD